MFNFLTHFRPLCLAQKRQQLCLKVKEASSFSYAVYTMKNIVSAETITSSGSESLQGRTPYFGVSELSTSHLSIIIYWI